ncbi:DUF262 domain-containing protein [Aquiflexum lacus]|uniref:DUF262 domain-containing protein n=1 Tax=Aquiflexum lacus TaxID=2483805 RepID=UPI001892F0B3|nr:DUF262 domain-containing protein [Aquiflexum lacus]
MADLHVSKKNISKLLTDIKGRKFIIPDFQRPYKWNIEKCETLWNDIESFSQSEAQDGSDYFLGTIVSYINEDKNQEIIDGQQRLTSFFLLLRAFYKKLESMPEDDDVKGLKNQIAPCIWDIDPISQKVKDFKNIHIESMVATEEDNEVFHQVLETGIADSSLTDNYSKNYIFFKLKCDSYAESNPLQWKQLCVTILTQCIILPIECETSETALTIFSTLNDRGLPLSDSDIFKAQIYKSKVSKEERKDFTNTWKELTQTCKYANLQIDDIFRYYSHVLRAEANDKTKEVGLRKFYSIDSNKRLKEEGLMDDIIFLANFWYYVNTQENPEEYEEEYKISQESQKYLHCLSLYPNDFWKYPTTVFFYVNYSSEDFSNEFTEFLKQLISNLFTKFINYPSVNAIKDDTYNTCISIFNGDGLKYRHVLNKELFRYEIVKHSSSRLSRALLLLHAYLNQKQQNIIPYTFDIEHIFPKKWQDTNYNGWNISDALQYLDRFGNKIIFEKKLNIQAGNGYFGIKKIKYAQSQIATVLDLGNYPFSDWVKKDIEQREEQFIGDILSFFEKYIPVEV